MSNPKDGAAAAAAAAGLKMSDDRAAEVGAEVERIRDGVAALAAKQFGFYDEPLHFLAALEAEAEDDA